MKTRILIADDHAIITDGVKSIIAKVDTYEVVGTALTGREAMEKAQTLKPDIIIMDIGMAELNGITATKLIRNSMPEIKIIILSVHSRKNIIFEAFKAGASGYVLKSDATQDILVALKSVCEGRNFISPAITEYLVDYVMHPEAFHNDSNASPLSAREIEVVQLVAEGNSAQEIADKLNISKRTVESHRANIMKKTGCRSIADLIKYAIKEGIIQVEG